MAMTLDPVVSIATDYVKRILDAGERHVSYSFHFNNYVNELEEENIKLISITENVLKRVEREKSENKIVNDKVVKQLEDAKSLTKEAGDLGQKAKGNKSYCFWHCPNFIWRYRVGKQSSKKAIVLKGLNESLEHFEEFAHDAPLLGMSFYSSEGFVLFNSTKKAYDELLMALKNEEVSMIGLHAMGGSGKTTLVKQVGKEVENNFEKVAFAVVSNNVDVKRIQGEIASYLDLSLSGKETLIERARSLSLRLTSGKKFLIILDDVWEKLDFEAIGIPFGENCKNCIVLLTTRRVQVCELMDCQSKIQLSLLGKEETWTLFQNHARIADKTSNSLNLIAEEIAKKCQGLPVAIVALASSLKGKTENEWEEALEKLREASPMDVEEGLRNPYACLQLSYDMLKSETAKSLFLLCSVFPEDYEIHEEYLVRYGIGLGLFGNLKSYKRARNQVSEAKNILLNSSLLLKNEKKQFVKMHDLVRDVALWIGKKENKMIVGPESSGELLKSNENFEANMIRYLWFDELNKRPNILSYPKLEFMCVKVSKKSILPNEVFKGMEELRVLILRNENFREMNPIVAKSIQWPTNLHSLFLRGWELRDTSFLSSLKKLDTLVLWNCSFDGLPEEIVELERLKLLDLFYCKIERNPYEVIQRCSNLEELYFVKNEGSGWEKEVQVNALSLDKNKAISCLQRYRIDMGTSSAFNREDFSITRGLCLTNFDAATCTATIKELAKSAQLLKLENINEKGWKNLIPDIHDAIGVDMNELENLMLYGSDKIECLVDTSNHLLEANTVFSKLIKLKITRQRCLETLWRGPVQVEMLNQFRSLKELELVSCPNLTSVSTCVVAQSLVLLEELIIVRCDSLKHIITDDEEMKSSTSMFPKLKRIDIHMCNEFEYLVSISFPRGFPQLESLEIHTCGKLKEVFKESIRSSHKDENESGFQIIDLPMLKELTLDGLPNMIYVCSKSHYLRCPSLKGYNMSGCPKLRIKSINNVFVADSQVINPQQEDTPIEEQKLETLAMVEAASSQIVQNFEIIEVRNCNVEGIFQLWGLPINREPQALTSSLKRLELFYLDELMYIFKGPANFISLANLDTLRVFRCKKLKYIFSACIMGGLPRLERLFVEDCDQLEQIIENEKPQNVSKTYKVDDSSKGSSSPGTSIHQNNNREITHDDHSLQSYASMFPRLKSLYVDGCDSLEYVLPFPFARGLQKLKWLRICRNKQLKHIFSQCNHQNFSYCQSQHNFMIELPALTEIWISNLPNISSNCYLKCPSLDDFSLNSVRLTSMNDMIIGSELRLCIHNMTQELPEHEKDDIPLDGEDDVFHITRQLQRLRISNCKIDTVFELEGLPISIREGGLVFNLSDLTLGNLSELRFLCKSPTQFLNLRYLNELYIWKCRQLKTIFSLPILRSFPQLQRIRIEECDELEQVIEEDEKDQCSSNYQFGQVYFPRLTRIVISKCNKLNCVFTVLSPHELLELERLCIEECSLLENVFALKGSEVEDGQEIRLPKLTKLILKKLPNLITICKGFNFQSLENPEVYDCPKLIFNDMPRKYQNTEEDKESKEESKSEGRGEKHMGDVEQSTPCYQANSNMESSSLEFDTSRSLENASKKTSEEPVHHDVTIEKYSAMASFLEGKETDFHTSTNQDVNMSAPLSYQILVEGSNQKKNVEDNTEVIEQRTRSYPKSKEVQKTSLIEADTNEVIHSLQDYKESDYGSRHDDLLKSQSMARHRGDICQEQRSTEISSVNKGENFNGMGKEIIQVDLTIEKPKELVRKISESEYTMTDQQIGLQNKKATQELPLLSRNSRVSTSFAPSPSPDQTGGSGATFGTPPTDAAIPSILKDLLSRLMLSTEATTYLLDGFWRYPWAFRLLESWSDKSWNWSYFVIFARVLYILKTTAAADLTESLHAELNSALNALACVGFEADWIASVQSRIRDCQASLANLHDAKELRATKNGIANQLIQFESRVEAVRVELAGLESVVETMRTELGRVDGVLSDYAYREKLARNAIGLP